MCCIAALCGAPAVARAQGGATDNEALKHAREQFGQALALQTGGDWAGALALFKEVAAVKPTPQVRFNIALCEERLGRLVAALGDYELAGSDAQAQKADQVRQEVDARLESLKARVPRVVVSRGEGAEAATISLDGVPLGDSVLNAPLPVDPGPHIVEATYAGYQQFKQSFRVTEQQNLTIVVKLQPNPTPVLPVLVAPAPRPAPQSMRTAGYVVGGAGIASLLASGAMFVLRHNAISDLDKQCGPDRASCPDSARSTVDRGKLYTTLGDVTLAIGAVSLATGALLVVLGGHSSERASLALAPSAMGTTGGGASLFGRF
jgi:tetratricopeptide (TPR) repeat protein